MVERSRWSNTEPPPFYRGYGSFRYIAKKPAFCWGSNSLTLPSAPRVNRFHMKTQTLRYAHSEVLRNPRFADLSGVTQLSSNPVYENNDIDDTDDVFLPDTPHNASQERNRMEIEKHTLQRTLCMPREGGFGAQEQSENVSWHSRIRKPSLELVAGRRLSQPGSLISMEEQSGSSRMIDKLAVKQNAMTGSSKKVRQAELGPEMTLKGAVNLLAQDNMETQITAANFIQNQCFNSPDAKKKIHYLKGIPKLLKLMQSDSEELQRAAVGALRNIVFENNDNKMAVKDCEGLPVILRLLKKNRDIETRRQLTAGPDGRKAMRDCEGLIECLIYYIRGTIADYKPDDKATENCVCILHNLSYRFDCELPCVDSPVEQQPKQNHNGETSNPGCFILNSPKNTDETQGADEVYPLLEENGSPHGVEWLWSAITVRMYLSLIAVSTNQHTKEASVGALQNLTASSGETSQAIAHFIVQKEGGLSQVKKMLQEGEKEEIRISVSLLKNISRYRELHADIVKQVLPELVAILPNSDRNVEQPIDITVMICHILINLSHASIPNTRAIINQGALPKIISISTKDNGFGPTRAGQAACILLHTLWRHSELHSSFRKQPLTMPLNDERPTSTSTVASEDQSSDTESSERCDSLTSSSDVDCSRQSFTSDSSSKHNSPSCSPPKTLTLDEVMASARDLSNLSLAHEIVVNRNFHLEPPDLPQNSLEKKVKDMVHKAFWDCLESELNDDPPEYDYAIKLLEEIRDTLLSFLNPGANRLRTQIMEVLDMDLIRQQADNNAVDIQGLVSYIINTMGKFCAPVRDDEIKKLKENSGNLVTLFKEIFRVLDLMKMDMVNFTIQSLRPELQRQSVEYERAKFQSILERTPIYSSIGGAVSGLPALVERLKKMTAVLLEGMHSKDFNLTETLGNVSAQICCEVNKSLAERNFPALPAELQETLKGQICDITQENNPIRTLVEGRVQQYFRVVLASTNSHRTPPPVPPGLGLIQPELMGLGVNFVNLVNFNKKVYGPFYVSILKNLLFIDMQAPTPQNGIIQGPPGSPLESK
ncbi:T-complex 11 2 [Labeo rohita]|uniref:T-complex 11 2 n=2 Tax=Labeonini TaxID=2743697 RepID=A0A498MAA6_LABRO|nr:T-complex 11 2 [Labeo rohita]